jgi:ABC-2 type transport system ATP-binding protein
MEAIQVKGLSKRIGKTAILDDIDLSVRKGSSFCLLGHNGAGKTTLISILTTMLAPTEGTADISGFSIKKSPNEVRKRIGVVFQDPVVDKSLTPMQMLYLQGLLYGMDKKDIRERSIMLLKLVMLDDRKDSPIGTFSGGMKRKVEVALGLMNDPDVLFLDEPTLGLDPKSRLALWDHIRKMNKDGKTVFFATNYIEEAEYLASDIAILSHGKLAIYDRKEKLLEGISKDRIEAEVEDISSVQKKAVSKAFPEASYEGKKMILKIENSGSKVQHIMEVLSKNKLTVKRFTMSKPTLSDVYMKHTGESID